MKFLQALAAIPLALLLLWPPHTLADDGHDHGDTAAPASGPTWPRFAAVSDSFELVGVLNGQQLTLYLDRAADNSPVADAQIQLDVAGKTYKAARQYADTFAVVLGEAPGPGVLPITATVLAGADTDLLAGELDIHAAAHADEPAHSHAWKELASWAAGGIAALALLLTLARRRRAARQARMGAAA